MKSTMFIFNHSANRYLSLILLLISSQSILAKDQVDDDSATANSFLNTDFALGFRMRHEQVEQGNQSAHANTAKFRLHSKTSINHHWQIELELDHVEALSEDHHSDGVTANGKLVIADPAGTELNQLFINANFDDIHMRLGRQKIAFSEQRFIGSVDFRQNNQTFDALSLKFPLLTSSQLDYAFINNVNRIFGDDASARLSPEDSRFENLAGVRPLGARGDHKVEGHLINFSIKEWELLELNSYLYSVDNKTLASFSNQTQGIRAEYRKKIAKTQLFSNIELAVQKQQESSVDDWVGYSLFEFGARYRSVQLSLKQERLNGKNGVAFITPLATLHKFQGWTDQFLNTPSDGLSDQQIRLQWRNRPVTIDLRFHRYQSINNKTQIGDESNIDIIYSPSREHELRLRYADFKAEAGQTIVPNSTTKLFVMYSYNL